VRSVIRLCVLAVIAAVVAVAMPAAAGTVTYTETYRPQFHFSPAINWTNDPNGLLYYRGEYHLFFQYNPDGTTWGNMSWGHAVSPDLVHWTQLPVAIPQDDANMIFSGSAVIDYRNTTGFGRPGNPAMVAIYTAASKIDGKQRQAIAYSLDNGRTFTKYGIVLDIGSANFRDPKVFWYAPGNEWLMTVSLSDQQKVSFYRSPDLKHWTHLSDFGPAGATDGAWECPDLFPMPDPDHPGRQKWVLTVNVGSGTQYFVGGFDGTNFTPDPSPAAPTGVDLGSFDGGTFGDWTATGAAFGNAPAAGSVYGQLPVTGYLGSGLANSFNSPAGDAATGTLASPDFTITRNYLDFLIGGGDHQYVPGSAVGDNSPPGSVFADFEGPTWGSGWTATGDFAAAGPAAGTLPNQQQVTGYEGKQLVDTYLDGDASTGTITSPTFTVSSHYIDLLVGGGDHPWGSSNPTAVNLVVNGQVVASATGSDAEFLNWVSWDVSKYAGQQASIQIVDDNTGGWGHLNVDQITFSAAAAAVRAGDTSVRLVVDGQVVRAATGSNSETLDWTDWNVSDLKGRTAHLEIVDNDTTTGAGAWAHILADQFTESDTAVPQRVHWFDFGADDYAAVTYNDAPGGRRIMLGWMNNWAYGQEIPTSPWRSAMTVPRELTLRDIDGNLQLTQSPVAQLGRLRVQPAVQLRDQPIAEGVTALPANAEAAWIDATLYTGTALRSGLLVRTGSGQQTAIGYDRLTGRLYVDRTRSGEVGFDAGFPSVATAPLTTTAGVVRLTILVDWSSVEVFAQDGRVLLTEQIFPSPGSTGLAAFATGGTATLRSITVSPMRSAWP
jgi:fructan beta-fructosidase